MRIDKQQGFIHLSERETTEWQRGALHIIAQIKRKALEIGGTVAVLDTNTVIAMAYCMPDGEVTIA